MSENAGAVATAAPQTTTQTQPNVSRGTQPGAEPAKGTEQVNPGTPAVKAIEQKLYELKANGRVRKVTEDELKSHASLGLTAHERLEEAARMRKEAEAGKEGRKKNLIGALLQEGFTKEQIRATMEQWYNKEFIQPEMMSPEQRRTAELEEKLKRYEEQENEQRLTQEQHEAQRMEQETRAGMQHEIITALESSGLPKNRYTVSRMAYWMRANLSKGFDAPMDVVVNQVRNESKDLIRQHFESASPEQLIELAGDEFIGKLRKADLERLKAKLGSVGGNEVSRPSREDKSPTRMSDVEKYFTSLRLKK